MLKTLNYLLFIVLNSNLFLRQFERTPVLRSNQLRYFKNYLCLINCFFIHTLCNLNLRCESNNTIIVRPVLWINNFINASVDVL